MSLMASVAVKNTSMNKKIASKQYAINQYGGNPGPGLGQKIKNLFKGGEKKSHPGAVTMECSKTGCSAYESGGGGSDVGSKSYAVKTSSATGGEKNRVFKKGGFAERRWQKKIGAVKANASARPMTRKEKEKASEMGPPRPDYLNKKSKKK